MATCSTNTLLVLVLLSVLVLVHSAPRKKLPPLPSSTASGTAGSSSSSSSSSSTNSLPRLSSNALPPLDLQRVSTTSTTNTDSPPPVQRYRTRSSTSMSSLPLSTDPLSLPRSEAGSSTGSIQLNPLHNVGKGREVDPLPLPVSKKQKLDPIASTMRLGNSPTKTLRKSARGGRGKSGSGSGKKNRLRPSTMGLGSSGIGTSSHTLLSPVVEGLGRSSDSMFSAGSGGITSPYRDVTTGEVQNELEKEDEDEGQGLLNLGQIGISLDGAGMEEVGGGGDSDGNGGDSDDIRMGDSVDQFDPYEDEV